MRREPARVMRAACRAGLLLLCAAAGAGTAQVRVHRGHVFATPAQPPGMLDPARAIHAAAPQASLPEEYIWTANDAAALGDAGRFVHRTQADKVDPHFFRAHFQVAGTPPGEATLYLAGPRSARVFLNGSLAAELKDRPEYPMIFRTQAVPVAKLLRAGENVIAIELVRGMSISHHTNSPLTAQLIFGEVLTAKIVPAAEGVNAAPLVYTSRAWKSTRTPAAGWSEAAFNDADWPQAATLGPIDAKEDFFQWNADAGLYAWPGYRGQSPYLGNYMLAPVRMWPASSRDAALLPARRKAGATLTGRAADGRGAMLLVDFGREVNGRIKVASADQAPMDVQLRMGESPGELQNQPFLGTLPLHVPANGTAWGPKSAFRYASVRLPAGRASELAAIQMEGIAYPVTYRGNFRSSDALLNRIWESAAYTAHICMQDGLWDGAKRDRGRWAGDMAIAGPAISDVFFDERLQAETLRSLVAQGAAEDHVNTFPNYTVFWIALEADLYRHFGSREELLAILPALHTLLGRMDRDVDAAGGFDPGFDPGAASLFVDWSPGLERDTPETRRITAMEYALGYREAAYLLSEAGDPQGALRAAATGTRVRDHARAAAEREGGFGTRWQTNAMAILSGVADAQQTDEIWTAVLSKVSTTGAGLQQITPSFAYFVLKAMAQSGHTAQAVRWMQAFWGGMLASGATSFWEAWDPRLAGDADPHRSLQADGKTGYYISLAHAWASGPVVFAATELLGAEPTAAGYAQVRLRPQLGGLAWIEGTVPTPGGDIYEHFDGQRLKLRLPPGVRAELKLAKPIRSVNGQPNHARTLELTEGTYTILTSR